MSARTAMLVSALACAGCFGTETGNPPLAPASMALVSSDPTIASLEPNAGVDAIEEAWVAIAAVYAIEGTLCDRVAAEPLLGETAGNLASGFTTDGLRAGTSCGIHVQPALAVDPLDAPAGFEGRTLFVRGTRADGTPFELASETVVHGFDVLAPSGELVLADGGAVILALDAATWLRDLDLSTIAPDPDGVARIEAGDAMLATFETGLASSLELFVDADGNGALDAAEQAAGPIAHSHP